ncbi:Rid family detoxifying hydrolase [Bifidobacterium sp. ESL0798]|uniref:RidA family protein n=1 Tax=Bifidobacterium sp. ESL0798 TaxID=2983235 RepID=UPI0023F7A309|nr:Rid family detoxifying hydrolase [Bifidobacterium sp. ESL0798]WEV74534.1 Rid family detoxifying hydrolase [Bifidobacterium sp. ESL0798]
MTSQTTPYSSWRKAGDTYYISGQLPLDPATGEYPTSIEDQTTKALNNLEATLADFGCTRSDIIKTTVFLRDFADFARFNKVYSDFFAAPYPARSAFQVAGLAQGANIEIEAIAQKES